MPRDLVGFTEEEVRENTWNFMLAISPRALDSLREVLDLLEQIHLKSSEADIRELAERGILAIESSTWEP